VKEFRSAREDREIGLAVYYVITKHTGLRGFFFLVCVCVCVSGD
jgi:hypothetical protein